MCKSDKKYRLLLPLEDLDTERIINQPDFNINRLYYNSNSEKLIYPSILFKNNNGIISKELISSLTNYEFGEEPIHIWNRFFHNESNLPYIYMYICNDIFFAHLNNYKT